MIGLALNMNLKSDSGELDLTCESGFDPKYKYKQNLQVMKNNTGIIELVPL
jgi:hypothetical protein